MKSRRGLGDQYVGNTTTVQLQITRIIKIGAQVLIPMFFVLYIREGPGTGISAMKAENDDK